MTNEATPLPKHVGPTILPDFPLFHRLLYIAVVDNPIAFHDVFHGIKATHAQFLSDVLHFRNQVQGELHSEIRKKLLRNEEVFICLIANGSYEFAVGFLAIVALGAIVVPIAFHVPVKEALYFAQTSNAVAVLTNSTYKDKGDELAVAMRNSGNERFFSMNVATALGQPTIPLSQISISSDHELLNSDPGIVIFTSGTTGPPKGALKKRSYCTNNAETFANWWNLQPNDTLLHVMPVHHSTGVSVNFFAPIVAGACVEFGASKPNWRFSPKDMWDRWLQGGLTVFSGVPTMYQRMMRYYEDEIVSKRGPQEAQRYTDAAKSIRLLLCGTSALPHSLQMKWRGLLGGNRKILERYGGTEFSGIFSAQPGDQNNPDGSAGKLLPGVEVKLSEEDKGEILMKSPHMFMRYLGKPEATAAAFTPDGWYKSGDIARKEGDYFFILGRESIDIIKSGGYKLSALDIEREIIGLEYIAEAVVVGVEDEEYGQKVAAAIVQRKEGLNEPLTIERLRADLRSRLAPYKLPLLLRVVEELPRTPSGKVVKPKVSKELFPANGHPDVQMYKPRRSKL
ncbi:unnamed protein product [Clonostachys rosea f. rosea IK726]|uniref:AMP-dependent synthetase/ligase domain-containing protein n=2 Tax=Bionectria ochroleuca TaxID=29856 RepID=A0A0B7KCG2_BIOOC|nr:unnamed protein product [Clonostachys rosea f. rosea IK726]